WHTGGLVPFLAPDRRLGLALGPAVPLVLQGEAPVDTWAESPLPPVDEDFMKRLAYMYSDDTLFARTLSDARGNQVADSGGMMANGNPRKQALQKSARAAAKLLSQADGPRIAVMESRGWDTHFAQERRLATLFNQLADSLLTLKSGLAEAWQQTTVIVVSEFGRTAAENGSRGTDHGVGGIAFVAGGAVNGGRVVGQWPGLAANALYEGRDVQPANAYESLFKGALLNRMGIGEGTLEDHVFPGSRKAHAAVDLFRRA
ncbi:MAG: DUF1501 domain-containing protein, partial [Pseudomonadota bacterium]